MFDNLTAVGKSQIFPSVQFIQILEQYAAFPYEAFAFVLVYIVDLNLMDVIVSFFYKSQAWIYSFIYCAVPALIVTNVSA